MMGMDEDTISQLMDRFYAIGQLSAQMQSIIEEIDYMIEGNAGPSIQAIRELGGVLNQVLEQEADQLVGLRDAANTIDMMISSIEHMKDRESVRRIMVAIERYKDSISGYQDDIEAIQDEPNPVQEKKSEPPEQQSIILPPDSPIDGVW